MTKIFINVTNDIITLGSFSCELNKFYVIESEFSMPNNVTEIGCSTDLNNAQYIKDSNNNVIQISEELRNLLLSYLDNINYYQEQLDLLNTPTPLTIPELLSLIYTKIDNSYNDSSDTAPFWLIDLQIFMQNENQTYTIYSKYDRAFFWWKRLLMDIINECKKTTEQIFTIKAQNVRIVIKENLSDVANLSDTSGNTDVEITLNLSQLEYIQTQLFTNQDILSTYYYKNIKNDIANPNDNTILNIMASNNITSYYDYLVDFNSNPNYHIAEFLNQKGFRFLTVNLF